MKSKIILLIVKLVMGATALGLGIWYISSSIGGASLGFASMSTFMTSIGAADGNIANVNGCFLCGYIEKLFGVIGNATEMFWTSIINALWILIAVGFGIFLFWSAGTALWDASKQNAKLDGKDKTLDFKAWFDKVWKQFLRVMFCGALVGVLGIGGTTALRGVAGITIAPVMFVGAELSMAATGISDSAQCSIQQSAISNQQSDILNPILQPFMCVMGNLNTVVLAGASGGFALMNWAWMDMGGGAFTWIAGLALVLMFLIIGFNLFFDVLNVIFKLVFIIIFLPVIIAAGAFEGTWGMAKNVIDKSITMLVTSALSVIRITLKIVILYATVSYAADEYFHGVILPPIINQQSAISNQQSSVINVFATCEQVSLTDDVVDKQKFKNCFTAQRAMIERTNPGAFDFMKNGWEFLLMMMGLFLLYYYAVSPKVDKLLGGDATEPFDYGKWLKELGQTIWNAPTRLTEQITKGKRQK